MNIIDISWSISSSMTQYKDKKRVSFESIGKDEPYVMEHMLTMHSHTGTHIDAPAHFVKEGAMIDQIPLERFIGLCYVADLTHVRGVIQAYDIQAIEAVGVERILLKTTNSLLEYDAPFEYNFVYVDKGAAQAIVDKGWQLIGIDYLGIERAQPAHETHIIIAQAGGVILEGLRLAQVNQGYYDLLVLPLSLQHIEAALARAVLINKNS